MDDEHWDEAWENDGDRESDSSEPFGDWQEAEG